MRTSILTVAGLLAAGLAAAAGLDKDALLSNIRETQDLLAATVVEIGDLQASGIPGFGVAELRVVYRKDTPPVVRKIFISDDNRHYVMDGFGDLTTNPDQDRIQKVDIANAPMRGKKNAPVTVIEFVDFQCPYCQRAYDFEGKILKDDEGQIRWVYKAMPLPSHLWAEPAAIAMECAKLRDRKKCWNLHDAIFQHQVEISTSKDPSARLIALAKESGFSSSKFLSCYENRATSGTVHKDIDEGQSAGINGTPGFLVNGHLIVGAEEQTLRLRIDESLQGKHGKY
jgi:protein-disulfide isomerase